jgi:hypothetical protein
MVGLHECSSSVREHGGVAGLELLPLVKDAAEPLELGLEPDEAVGVECAQLVEVHDLLLPLEEPAEVCRVHELRRHAVRHGQVARQLLDQVLLVLPGEPLPRLVPSLVEGHRPGAGLGVHEPAVGALVQVVGVVAVEGVGGHGEVYGDGDAQQRVPEPDDVHVREHEAVPERQHTGLEPVPAPHHVQVVLGHEPLLRREVGAALRERVAERVRPPAQRERLGVGRHDHQVLQQRLRPHAGTEALQEKVHERAGSRPRQVREGHYDGLVLHGCSAQDLGKLVVVFSLFLLIGRVHRIVYIICESISNKGTRAR